MTPLLLLLLSDLDVPSSRSDLEVTHDFATLRDVRSLVGKPARYRIRLDSLEDECESYRIFDCDTADATRRSVYFRTGQPLDRDDYTVAAVLIVLHHKATVGADGTLFVGFTEYRLVNAVPLYEGR